MQLSPSSQLSDPSFVHIPAFYESLASSQFSQCPALVSVLSQVPKIYIYI